MSTRKNPDSLLQLKGIGEKMQEKFSRLGVETIDDLLRNYPRDYDAFQTPVRPGEAVPGSVNAVRAFVSARPSVKNFGRKSVIMLYLKDAAGELQVNWFNMPFLRSTIKAGTEYIFRGSVIEKNGRKIMEHPEIFTADAYREQEGKLLPIYALTDGLSNKAVRKAVAQALSIRREIPEFLPSAVREQYDLWDRRCALKQIHFPESGEKLLQARKRLVFDEFFLFLLGVVKRRALLAGLENHFPMERVWKTEEVIETLPYRLTDGQKTAWNEIERDLHGRRLMSRMLQGDVGSGKTILAFLAMILTYENGYQSVLMAPTEVLATQHDQALRTLLAKNGMDDVCPVLLTGSMTSGEKKKAYEKIASGEAGMIIGTHALIQEKVLYSDLGLIVIDEQHRFGVRQREVLTKKGYPPNVLIMSATPIPRTLAMILYGDLDLSVIREKPKERLPIKNCAVGTSYRESAYRFMEKELANGHQIYVICPMVSPNEDLPCENVEEYTEKMKARFPGTEVRMLHGQMKPKDKEKVMADFSAGKIRILVSTTVIEVGINVPNATVMLVENAERFGLAQLHQLRGRVGRGKDQSYCIFIQGDGQKENQKRLEILTKSNDGFRIAEEDLKLRGPGDLLGIRQSGEVLFGIADIYRDHTVLLEANEAVQAVLAEDPELSLPENRLLAEKIREMAENRIAGEACF